MRLLLSALFLLASVASAQTPALTFYVHDTHGILPDTPLPPIYQLASTAVGSGSPLVLKAINTSGFTIFLANAVVTVDATSTVESSNFSITGLFIDLAMPPGGSVIFTVNFTPASIGLATGFLHVAYQIQRPPNCVFTTPGSCASAFDTVSTLTGTATAPALVLSCPQCPSPFLPESATLDLGSVLTSATESTTFTLSNPTDVDAAAPAIALLTQIFANSAFSLDATAVPVSIPAHSSATFTVTFAPGQTGLLVTTLVVGSDSYPLAGVGASVSQVENDIDALQVYYVDATDAKGYPQAATPIPFGQILSGATSTLTFHVMTSTNSYDPVTATVNVTGADFTISGAPANPVSFPPGQDVPFTLTFAPPSIGVASGTLSFANSTGARQFLLTGQGIAPLIPAITLQTSPSPLSSQQQATLLVQLASPSPAALGTVTTSFLPAGSLPVDPVIGFLDGTNLSLKIAANAQTATATGPNGLAFHTGTTAGKISFTVTFPNTPVTSQSFDIPAAKPQITSGTATRQLPELVIIVNGYDNTYSAGSLSFTFYDLSNRQIQAPIPYDATTAFHNYFFTNNQVGGMFTLQASFPVNGDITQIGSVAVTMTNSQGPTTTTLNFTNAANPN